MLGSIIVTILVAHPFMVPTQASANQQPPNVAPQPAAEKPWPPPGVTRIGAGVVPPRVIKDPKPGYTREAMNAGITGVVVMEAVIERDGTVGEVRVKRSLDRKFGLDDEAVRALKTWQLTPAKKDGVAVPVLVEVEMTFNMRK